MAHRRGGARLARPGRFAIRDAVREAGELDLGIGVASGPVFAWQLGSSSRFEYAVIGDAVNEDARLAERAESVPGRILASGTVIGASYENERTHWAPRGEIRLRGRQEPTATWAD
jgi:adenylate cyclase